MPALYLLPLICVAVLFLILAEFRHNRKQIYFIKPLSTLLVILMAIFSFLQPNHNITFSIIVLIGLLFCLGGDVALMFQENQKAFRSGLVLFLMGHVAYIFAFSLSSTITTLDIFTTLLLLSIGIGFYQLIKANLGKMRISVILYMVIISLMVNRAIAVGTNQSIANTQSVMIIVGAILFYVSDIILAANRFWKPWRCNRISLAFYYAGQMLIALSASYYIF